LDKPSTRTFVELTYGDLEVYLTPFNALLVFFLTKTKHVKSRATLSLLQNTSVRYGALRLKSTYCIS